MYNFKYNTIRGDIRIPEYGRHVQDMVEYAVTIENSEERQKVAEEIVRIMMSMSDSDSTHFDRLSKAWKHIIYISRNKLEVDIPKGVEISRSENLFSHEPLDYPQQEIPFKHYGMNVHTMLEKAKGMENEEFKEEYVKLIGSYMKMAYKIWHSDQFINDETVKNDIEAITKGGIKVDLEETEFNSLDQQMHKRRPKPRNSGGRNQQGRRRRKY